MTSDGGKFFLTATESLDDAPDVIKSGHVAQDIIDDIHERQRNRIAQSFENIEKNKVIKKLVLNNVLPVDA